MAEITFDESRWPLVVVTFPATFTESEFETHLGRSSGIVARGKTLAVIMDIRDSAVPTAKQRQQVAAWWRSPLLQNARHFAGTAWVVRDPLVRGALTAIFWLQPLPVQTVVMGTMEAAEDWCRSEIAGHHSLIPSAEK